MNIKEFTDDIQSSQHLSKSEKSVDELIEVHNKGVQSVYNHPVPSCSNIIRLRPETPWCFGKLRSAKKIRRKAENLALNFLNGPLWNTEGSL